MSKLVSTDIADGIATIRMDDGKANVLSFDMLAQLGAAFDEAEAAGAVIIFTGREGGIFSGGYDLSIMMSGPENAVKLTCEGSRFALRICRHPFPVIIANTGHAIAMGAFLHLAADFRIGADAGTKTGLNETQIGMTMHHFGIELAREFIPKNWLNRSMVNGEIFAPEDARSAGYYDVLVPKDEVMGRAKAVAAQMKLLNMRAFKGTKRKSRKAFLDKLEWAIDVDSKMSVLE